jgi:dTDP-4-amino-4,6-dideoxygalactose transaminase
MAAYRALDLTNIFIPAYTFKSTEVAATIQGMYRSLVDVDHLTGCLDKIPNYPNNPPDGIVAVCALSTIPNLDELEETAKRINAKLVIDGAATFGTPGIYNYGDAFCLSMHATKTFSIGECGALIADHKTIEKAKQFINFGFNDQRIPQMVGMNAKISEYTAAIGLAVFEKLPEAVKARKKNLEIYDTELGHDNNHYIPPSMMAHETIYQALPMHFTFDHERAKRVRAKLTEAKVEILQYYRPLDYQKNTEMLYLCNVCLPIHQDLTEEEIRFICNIIKSC